MTQHGNKQKYESRNPAQQALIRHFQRQAVALVKRVRPATVLDIGCGEGYMLQALVDGGVSARLVGVDMSAAAIAEAESRLGGRVELGVADAMELADAGRQFDLVMMLEVLEHLEDPGAALDIACRLSAGHVLLSVPWEPFFRGLNLARGKNVRRLGNDPEHVNHWSRRSFQRFVGQRAEIVASPVVFPWAMVLARTGR